MELKKITKCFYYIPNQTNIGVIKDSGNSVIIIDTGLDDYIGRKILKLLRKNNLFVKAVVNTHSHADHCGGNKFIKKKTGAVIYAPEVESAIIQYPCLEPIYLFSGASPLRDLQNKFLMAQPSDVDYVIKKDKKKLQFDEIELTIVPLPGHSINQIGIEVDNILFCADSLFSKEVLKRYKIPFFTDIDKTRKTLKFLRNSQYKFYIPSHAKPRTRNSLAKLADANLECINSIERYILDNFYTRKTTEQIVKELCIYYRIDMINIQQYYLMNTITMAYLSSLYKREKIKIEVKDNFLYWYKIN